LHEVTAGLSDEDHQHIVANLKTINFAQAALVLQNSSNIYSRKVEYLHSLVYKALEEFSLVGLEASSSKKKRNKNVDGEIDDFLNFDPHQEFLPLDDVVPTDQTDDCHKINLKEEKIDRRRSSLQSPGLSTTRFSLGAKLDKSTSYTNDAAQRALIGSLDAGTLSLVGDGFNMGQDGFLRTPVTNSAHQKDVEEDHCATPMTLEEPDQDFGGLGGGDGEHFDDGNDDDFNDDNDGAGFAMAEDYGEPAPEPVEEPQRRVTFAVDPKPEKKDDWDLLDPHTSDKQKPRPLRVGKTIRLPAGLQALPSECVTGARTRRVARRERVPVLNERVNSRRSFAVDTFKATLAARKRNYTETVEEDESSSTEEKAPAVPLKGLAFGNEFSYIARATASRRDAERRERRKQQLATPTLAPVDDGDDDDVGGFAFAGDEDDDDFDYGGAIDGDNEQGPLETNTGMASVDDIYKRGDEDVGKCGIAASFLCFWTESKDKAHPMIFPFFKDNFTENPRSFEELCRAHIQAFAKGAERYASETKLSQRVGQWQARLVPLLEEEENRPVFDIYVYGQKVVDTLERVILRSKAENLNTTDELQKVVSFRKLTRDCPPHEVCRMLLASLSLANSGNLQLVDIARDGASLQLELLTSEIERPMETYLAPSLTDMTED
jgi:condensin-2 complex subunit H2